MKNRKCLLVIDVQNGMFNLPRELYKGSSTLENIYSLISKARETKTLIVFMQHSGNENTHFGHGSKNWQIHAKVAPRKNEIIIEKKHPDSFQNTKLDGLLKNSNINNIVICGFVTEGCVDTTVRRAYSLGNKLEVAGDAHSTTDSEILSAEQIINHHNEVFKIFSKVKRADEIYF